MGRSPGEEGGAAVPLGRRRHAAAGALGNGRGCRALAGVAAGRGARLALRLRAGRYSVVYHRAQRGLRRPGGGDAHRARRRLLAGSALRRSSLGRGVAHDRGLRPRWGDERDRPRGASDRLRRGPRLQRARRVLAPYHGAHPPLVLYTFDFWSSRGGDARLPEHRRRNGGQRSRAL